MNPKFSIITCTFNSVDYLKRNIDSVIEQEFKNFEHIFIDGFSTDGTLGILEEYRKKFPDKVKVFKYKANGISNAMNLGIKHSNGEYLIHLHSDDLFYDKFVLTDVDSYLKENDFDWIYGRILIRNQDSSKVGVYPNKKIFYNDNNSILGKYILKFHNYIPHQAVFIKKEVFDKHGLFDESLKSAMDPDLWLRIRNKTKWSYLNKTISNFYLREDAQSSGKKNMKRNKKDHWIVQKRYLNKIETIFAFLINIVISFKSKKNYR
jgi:glycosyltransferase involved in cell wall biosynthesis